MPTINDRGILHAIHTPPVAFWLLVFSFSILVANHCAWFESQLSDFLNGLSNKSKSAIWTHPRR